MPSRQSDVGMTNFRDLEQHSKPWPFLFYLVQVVTGEYYLQVVSSVLDGRRTAKPEKASAMIFSSSFRIATVRDGPPPRKS
jgi:hypothetical protein